jgi:hypothetical protein
MSMPPHWRYAHNNSGQNPSGDYFGTRGEKETETEGHRK